MTQIQGRASVPCHGYPLLVSSGLENGWALETRADAMVRQRLDNDPASSWQSRATSYKTICLFLDTVSLYIYPTSGQATSVALPLWPKSW